MAQKEKIILRSKYSIEQCKSVLEKNMRIYHFYWGSSPFFIFEKGFGGTIWDNKFQVFKFSYRNNFAPFFFGEFSQETGGTLVTGYFGYHRFTKFVFLLTLVSSILILVPQFSPITLLFVIGLFFLTITRIARSGKTNKDLILAFLKEKLGAK